MFTTCAHSNHNICQTYVLPWKVLKHMCFRFHWLSGGFLRLFPPEECQKHSWRFSRNQNPERNNPGCPGVAPQGGSKHKPRQETSCAAQRLINQGVRKNGQARQAVPALGRSISKNLGAQRSRVLVDLGYYPP